MPDFVRVLETHIDRSVARAFELSRDAGCLTVLATAALGEYSEPLGRALGFDLVIATDIHERGVWKENIGVAKRDATLRELEGKGRPFRILFSDHVDDVPLADVCFQSFWVDRGTNPGPNDILEPPYSWPDFREWFAHTVTPS